MAVISSFAPDVEATWGHSWKVVTMLIMFGIITYSVAFLTAETRLLGGQLEAASDKGFDYIVQFIDDHGNYSIPSVTENDLCFFFKLPLILYTGGKLREAHLVLDYIKDNFMQSDGDFRTSQTVKACHPTHSSYYTYSNVWITLAAHRMERYDVVTPALAYLEQYNKKFTTEGPPSEGHTITTMFTLAQHGVLALQIGGILTASRAARLIKSIIQQQPNTDSGFYYKLNKSKLITEFPESLAHHFFVNRTAPDQIVLLVGKSAEFLAKYSMFTGNAYYMDLAKGIISWLSTCDESMYTTVSSMKVAVDASWVGAFSGDSVAKDMAARISSYLLSIQNADGSFPGHVTFMPGNAPEISYSMRVVDALASLGNE
uniref:Alpha-macroglobulin-like TED domain-containing protein n=1 Tax=Capitella teleta TaxID=283909 RepID=X2ACE9_CAPTE